MDSLSDDPRGDLSHPFHTTVFLRLSLADSDRGHVDLHQRLYLSGCDLHGLQGSMIFKIKYTLLCLRWPVIVPE